MTFLDDQNNVPIIKSTVELYKVYYSYKNLFPKKDRYTLGEKCERYIIDMLELVLKASTLPKDKKLPLVEEGSDKLDILKIFIRLLKELQIIDNNKNTELQNHIAGIGKMFGGWLKSLKEPPKEESCPTS